MSNNITTKEGFEKAVKELEYLKSTRREEISQQLKSAIEQGDLSENSEYEEAKNQQAFVESRILELEAFLKTTTVVDVENNLDTTTVSLGKIITVENCGTGEIIEFKLVGNNEASPSDKAFSIASPAGKELFGKSVGDTVTVKAPFGDIYYKILNVAHK